MQETMTPIGESKTRSGQTVTVYEDRFGKVTVKTTGALRVLREGYNKIITDEVEIK